MSKALQKLQYPPRKYEMKKVPYKDFGALKLFYYTFSGKLMI